MRLFSFLFLLSPLLSIGQVNVDSLSTVWENQSYTATIRLQALYQIYSKGYLYAKPDSAFAFAQLAHDFAQSKNLVEERALAMRHMGIAASFMSDYTKATNLLQQTIEIEEQNNNEIGIAKALNSLANVYLQKSDYANAIEHYTASLKILESLGDKKRIKGLFNNIALVYMDMEDHDKSLEYLNKALNLSKEIKTDTDQSFILVNIGTVYRKKKEYQKALGFYEMGLEQLKQKVNSKPGMARCYSNLGLVYQEFGDRQKALDYFAQSLQLNREVRNKKGIANCLIHFGTLYQDTNLDSSIVLAEQALSLAQETGSLEEISDAAELLSNNYQINGEGQLAIQMNQLFHDTKDSMYSIKNQKAVLISEFKSQEEKNKIKYEAELLSQQRKVIRERFIGAFGLLLLLGGLAYFIYGQYNRHLKEKNKLLAKIEVLKKSLAAQAISSSGKRIEIALNKAKIEKFIGIKLGESSWMILNLIFKRPSISNKEIAQEVSLSIEGVSSSLRRMYSSFRIKSSSSKKIALITEAIRISTEE